MSPMNIEVDSWGRKELFQHYKDYDNPFFNLCVRVDIARFYRMIKQRKFPFSLSLLYLCLRVANNQKCFRYRIRNDEVVLLDRVNAAMTILRDEDYFDFCYFQYTESYFDFLSSRP